MFIVLQALPDYEIIKTKTQDYAQTQVCEIIYTACALNVKKKR